MYDRKISIAFITSISQCKFGDVTPKRASNNSLLVFAVLKDLFFREVSKVLILHLTEVSAIIGKFNF